MSNPYRDALDKAKEDLRIALASIEHAQITVARTSREVRDLQRVVRGLAEVLGEPCPREAALECSSDYFQEVK